CRNGSKRIPVKGQHVTAEKHCNPDHDCGCRDEFGCDRGVVSFMKLPWFFEQHEVEDVDCAQHHQDHFQKEKESRVLLRSRYEEDHPRYEIQSEPQHAERKELKERRE